MPYYPPASSGSGIADHDHSVSGTNHGGLIWPRFNYASYNYEYEEFHGGGTGAGAVGKLGWTSTNGVGISYVSTSGRPGVVRRDTGTTINTVAGMFQSNNIDPTDTFDIIWLVKLGQTDANFTIRLGMVLTGQSLTSPPSNGIYFEKASTDTNWFGNVRASSTDHRTDTGSAISTNWARLRLRRVSSTDVNFSVDGGTEVTVSTTSPTGGHQHGMHIIPLVSAASKTADIDYWDCLVTASR